jgi:hypothetical protein
MKLLCSLAKWGLLNDSLFLPVGFCCLSKFMWSIEFTRNIAPELTPSVYFAGLSFDEFESDFFLISNLGEHYKTLSSWLNDAERSPSNSPILSLLTSVSSVSGNKVSSRAGFAKDFLLLSFVSTSTGYLFFSLSKSYRKSELISSVAVGLFRGSSSMHYAMNCDKSTSFILSNDLGLIPVFTFL